MNKIRANVAQNTHTIHAHVVSVEPIHGNIVKGENKIAGMSAFPSATETAKGLIRIATEDEAQEGVIHNASITPRTLKGVNYETTERINTRIDKMQQDEDEEMEDIIACISQRTETFIDLNE